MADLFLVPYVRAVWQMLGHHLGSDGRMCIYGAGAHTRWLLSVTDDLPPLPIECILDDEAPAETLAGLPVRRPDETDPDSIGLVLVSSDQWEERLAESARRHWGDRVEIVRLYEGLPAGPYDKSDDRTEAFNRVKTLSVSRPAAARQVVIVSDQPRSREAKIGYALRDAGWHPVLLHRRHPTFDASRYFDEVHHYRSQWEALRLACDYSPVVYHLMANSDYRTAEVFLSHRPGLVVIDSYDLIAGMYTEEFLDARPAYAEQIERERFCLEHADGVCTRSRECEFLEEHSGYKYRRCMFFPDGCWNEPTPQRCDSEGLHVVYSGVLVVERDNAGPFATHGYRLWLARALADQGIHFHLYPAVTLPADRFEEVFSEYRELARESGYFHLHRPLPADRIVHELSGYDLGIFVYNEFSGLRHAQCPLTPAKLRCCTSNKFYDYLDAALPIVHNAAEGSLLSQIVDKHGVGIEVRDRPVSEWGELLRGLDLKDLRARAQRARSDYDVRRQAPRLTDFYRRLRMDVGADAGESTPRFEEHGHADRRSDHRSAIV
jgi:hypothetical protein